MIARGKQIIEESKKPAQDQSVTGVADVSGDRSRDRSANSFNNRSNNRSLAAQVSKLGDVSKNSRGNDSRSRLDQTRDQSMSRMTSPMRGSHNPNTINLRNLRKFDKATGGFRDKNFSEEYSVNKAEKYLQRSASRPADRVNSKSPVT